MAIPSSKRFGPKRFGPKRFGFTLIELSVVLVIIGLLVGGVLVGRDLIKSAQIKRAITQIEEYKTAVELFRQKYGGLPGDIPKASQLNFTTRTGASGHGDGDGWIESCSSSSTTWIWAGCEVVLFWSDLNRAGLINGPYTAATDAYVSNVPASSLETYFPRLRVGTGNYFTVWSQSGENLYAIGGLSSTTGPAYVWDASAAFTPVQALAIDTKIDDGLGTSLSPVRAFPPSATQINSGAMGPTKCLAWSGTDWLYNTTAPYDEQLLCNLSVKF